MHGNDGKPNRRAWNRELFATWSVPQIDFKLLQNQKVASLQGSDILWLHGISSTGFLFCSAHGQRWNHVVCHGLWRGIPKAVVGLDRATGTDIQFHWEDSWPGVPQPFLSDISAMHMPRLYCKCHQQEVTHNYVYLIQWIFILNWRWENNVNIIMVLYICSHPSHKDMNEPGYIRVVSREDLIDRVSSGRHQLSCNRHRKRVNPRMWSPWFGLDESVLVNIIPNYQTCWHTFHNEKSINVELIVYQYQIGCTLKTGSHERGLLRFIYRMNSTLIESSKIKLVARC